MEILIDCDEYSLNVESKREIDYNVANVFYLDGPNFTIGETVRKPVCIPTKILKVFICLDPYDNQKYWLLTGTRTRTGVIKREITIKNNDIDLNLLDVCPLCNVFIPYKYLRLQKSPHENIYPICPACNRDLTNYVICTKMNLWRMHNRHKDYVKAFSLRGDVTVESVKWARKLAVEKKIICEVCGKLVLWKQHAQVHDDTKVVCKVCGVSIMRRTMERHMRKFHDTALCEQCGKIVRVSHFWRHRRVHEGKTFNCSKCDSQFHYKKSLDRHQMVHVKDKSAMFLCKFCGNLYTSAWNLQQHVRIHTNVTPYRCLICKKNFRYNCTLKRHIVTNHPGKSIEASITRIMNTSIGKEQETMEGVMSDGENGGKGENGEVKDEDSEENGSEKMESSVDDGS